MTRPIPVTLSAILLGLFAILQVLAALGTIAVAIFTLHKGIPVSPGVPQSPLPPSFLPIMMFAVSAFYVGLAVWSILTLVGLVRLRSWARYSILVMGGLMAGFGGMAMLMSIALPFFMPSLPGSNPNFQRAVFVFIGLFYGIFAAIGIALLVYYNLASTRAVFQQFAPVDLSPPNTSTGRPRPTAVSIIGWFFVVSSPFCLLYALFPFPAFLLGFLISGFSARIVYAAYAAVSFAIGYGLLRLRNGARIAIAAWMGFGILNMLAMLTPQGKRGFQAYMDMFVAKTNPAATTMPFNFVGIAMVSCLVGVAFTIVILWLLHRHRIAFTPAPPPLEAPLTP